VGFYVAVSCSKPARTLRVECDEAGLYQIDVAKWTYFKGSEETAWIYNVTDAVVKAKASYAQPGTGSPTYPSDYSAQIQSYQVTWGSNVKIPKTTGALNVIVPSDLDGKTKVDLTFLLLPAVSKDTVTDLADLRGDPESNVFFNGQLSAKVKIRFDGKDLLTDEDLSTEAEMTVVLADYMDPNQLH
jgi:hypothetical protein